MRAVRAGALALVTLFVSGDVLQAQASQPDPVRVGGSVKAPTKVKDVAPVYPAGAKRNRVQGIVVLDLLIAPDGAVMEVKIVRPIPELNDAAVSAVKQWRYEPTKVEGVTVPVRMAVSLKFSLN
jgi:TonB family protein